MAQILRGEIRWAESLPTALSRYQRGEWVQNKLFQYPVYGQIKKY
jgi:hypothetical protein